MSLILKPNSPQNTTPAFKPKLTGLAAKIAAAKETSLARDGEIEINPSECEHRIGIIFDDSGSMSGDAIKNARLGCEEFLRSCEKNKTAVAVYPFEQTPQYLNSNLPLVAFSLPTTAAADDTPLIQTLVKMLQDNKLTRAIVFSDGLPTHYGHELYQAVISHGIPVDTVSIGTSGVDFMRKLAKDTGGIHLEFKADGSNFRTAFKYLSPGLRYMLADKSFISSLEK